MTLPLALTTIEVQRPADNADLDPTSAPGTPVTVAAGIRAVISSPSGSTQASRGEQEVVEFRLSCDPVELLHTDRVRDETTGEVYLVTWARPRAGLGLDHVQAGLQQVRGEAA